MNIQVEKEDIKRTGNACYNKNGSLVIICEGDTFNVEKILLRSILNLKQ